ncbi:MAG: hypothetical protein WC335_05385 [Candidatus Omnitrophota bacterium]|jgi:hypothetical protein
MEFTTEKSIGLTLLCVGLFIIGVAVYQGVAVFSGANIPPSIAKIQELVIASSSMDTSGVKIGPMKLMVNKEMNAVIDMSLWAVLMLLLVTAGGKIAGVGAQMMRDVRIVVKE